MTPIVIGFEHIKLMLQTSKEWQSAVKWTANAFMMIGALFISLSVGLSGQAAVFLTFLTGHILWASAGWAMGDRALITLNVGFIPIDLYAIYIRL